MGKYTINDVKIAKINKSKSFYIIKNLHKKLFNKKRDIDFSLIVLDLVENIIIF